MFSVYPSCEMSPPSGGDREVYDKVGGTCCLTPEKPIAAFFLNPV